MGEEYNCAECINSYCDNYEYKCKYKISYGTNGYPERCIKGIEEARKISKNLGKEVNNG